MTRTHKRAKYHPWVSGVKRNLMLQPSCSGLEQGLLLLPLPPSLGPGSASPGEALRSLPSSFLWRSSVHLCWNTCHTGLKLVMIIMFSSVLVVYLFTLWISNCPLFTQCFFKYSQYIMILLQFYPVTRDQWINHLYNLSTWYLNKWLTDRPRWVWGLETEPRRIAYHPDS